ncbi:MAG TPA: hypothetical protein VFG50_02630 [Rhodothermales bacterium]|nr:hypothetical protein [Rhodothermales bacterium]
MQRLRSIWVLRLVAALLVVSLAPTITGPTVQAAPDSASAYADWLGGYLQHPDHPAVKQALDAAAESHAATFERFLRIFVDAYEAQHPVVPVAQIFSVRAQSTDALVHLLYGRYQQKLGGSATPQGTLSAAPSLFAGVTDRAMSVLPTSVQARRIGAASVVLFASAADVFYVRPIRTAWAALPQGP